MYSEYCQRSKDVTMPMQNARLEAAKAAMKERLAKGIDISLAPMNPNRGDYKAL